MGVSSTVRIKASRKLCQFGKYVGHKNDRWCPKMCRKVRVFRLTKKKAQQPITLPKDPAYTTKKREECHESSMAVSEKLSQS